MMKHFKLKAEFTSSKAEIYDVSDGGCKKINEVRAVLDKCRRKSIIAC